MQKIMLVGSNSIHCKRYITGVINSQNYAIHLITNQLFIEFATTSQTIVDFSLRNLPASRQIRAQIIKFQPDIIHIHQANSYAWHTLRALRGLKPRPKVILTTWGSDILILPKQNQLFRRIVRYNLTKSDIITSDSLYMSAKISELLKQNSRPIYTINFGMQQLPEIQNLEHKQKVILSNRLHKALYQVDKIILAFAYLLKHELIDNAYKLVIAASGEEHDSLQNLVRTLGISANVVFTGMLSYVELIKYYQQAQVFVSVPNSDSTSSSLLEAMAYGLIPVLSNLPANLEWVLDEINGFIVPEVEQLQVQLLAAIKLSQDKLAYQQIYDFNYALIAKKASFNNNLQQFFKLYTVI